MGRFLHKYSFLADKDIRFHIKTAIIYRQTYNNIIWAVMAYQQFRSVYFFLPFLVFTAFSVLENE